MIDLNDAPAVRGSHTRYDLDAIVSALRATAQTWVPRLFPNGRRVGDEWRLANINGAPPRNQGSCVIALIGQHAGDWHDFDTGEGGGPLSAIEHATGLSGRELFAYAADLVGWTPSEATRRVPAGPTPLHLIEKPTPGTGATLMVDAIATILTGTGASVMTEGRDDEEWRKRMTAKLRQIPAMVLIDNLRHRLDSSAVAAALTAPFWEDRILGVSEMARMPIRCVWVATGNNPEFSNEMARRIVRIRLDAHVERPWQRAGFRHPDLLRWVRTNRAHIVAAYLTLCQAWIAAGRPRGTRTIGSYENWSQIVGGVLEIARIEGFLGNLDEMLEASDSEGMVWRNFVCAWWDRFGTAEVGTADLYELALKCEPPLPLGAGNEKSQRIRLGKALVRMRDRIFDHAGIARRIAASGISHQAKRWQLVIAGTPDEPVANRSTGGGGECREPSGNVADKHSPSHPFENAGVGEGGEGGECFSILTRARARARVKEDAEQRSPPSPHSQSPESPGPYAGESGGESRSARSPISDEPGWLKDVQ